jgi:hypothetical protein
LVRKIFASAWPSGCQAIDEDANASGVTRGNLLAMMTRYATTRLRVEDLVRRHPEILDIPIERPIIVAGLPRSGTTHLLGLLSADTVCARCLVGGDRARARARGSGHPRRSQPALDARRTGLAHDGIHPPLHGGHA